MNEKIQNDEEIEKVEKVKKKRKKIDKSQLAIRIVATFLAVAMILPVVISAIYYIMGE